MFLHINVGVHVFVVLARMGYFWEVIFGVSNCFAVNMCKNTCFWVKWGYDACFRVHDFCVFLGAQIFGV